MNLNQVKTFMNKIVYYDTGQVDMEGCRRGARAGISRIRLEARELVFSAREF